MGLGGIGLCHIGQRFKVIIIHKSIRHFLFNLFKQHLKLTAIKIQGGGAGLGHFVIDKVQHIDIVAQNKNSHGHQGAHEYSNNFILHRMDTFH